MTGFFARARFEGLGALLAALPLVLPVSAAAVDLLESAFSQEVAKTPAGQIVLAGAERIQYGEPAVSK